MNYEQLIEAKVRLTEIDAIAGICLGGVFILVAVWMVLISKWRKENFESAPWILIAIVCAFFGTIATLANTYNLMTAEIQARADLANYNLIELKK